MEYTCNNSFKSSRGTNYLTGQSISEYEYKNLHTFEQNNFTSRFSSVSSVNSDTSYYPNTYSVDDYSSSSSDSSSFDGFGGGDSGGAGAGGDWQ